MSPSDPPTTRESLGRATWTFLHTLAATHPAAPSSASSGRLARFVRDFSHIYPCDPCASSLRVILERMPPENAARAGGSAFADYMCRVHNEVNKELGKDEFDCGKVGERWGVCESCVEHEDELKSFVETAGIGGLMGLPGLPGR